MSKVFEDLLSKDGQFIYKTQGKSMEPMLRQNRDLVIIQVPSSYLKKYDVAFYKRENKYVLHRVIGVKDDYYQIRGDNTYSVEKVPFESVIGVLKSFKRKDKMISVTNKWYQLYSKIWLFLYPVRFFLIFIYRSAVKFARIIGILPLLKRLLRKNNNNEK